MKTHYKLLTIMSLLLAMQVALYAQPANDDCGGATSLTSQATCNPTAGDVSGATESMPGCLGTADDDVWYSFVANTTGATIEVDGSLLFDAVVEVFEGGCGGLTSLDCSDNSLTGGTEIITLTGLTVGATYYIRVYDYYTGTPTTSGFDICVTDFTPPPGSSCSDSEPFCTDSGALYPAGVNNGNNQPSGNSYDCGTDILLSQPNAAWFYLEIDMGGDLYIDLTTNPAEDIDFAAWGPFPDLASALANCGSLPAPISCSFSASSTEQVVITGAVAGEVYLLMITNYSNSPTDISANLNTGLSTGSTDCSILCTVDAGTVTATTSAGGTGPDLELCDGESASLVSNGDYILPPPAAGEDSELMYAIYNCAPDPAISNPENDPCFSGLYWTGEVFDINNAAAYALNNGGFPPAFTSIGVTGTAGTIWMVPITADDGDNNGNPNGGIGIDTNNDGCWTTGETISITYNTPTPDVNEIYNGCVGDGYSFLGPDGVTYDETNPSVNTTAQDANGCDFDLVVNLTFNIPDPDVSDTYNGCEGDGYSFLGPDGVTYNEANPFVNTTLQDGNGCDYNLFVDLTFNALTPDVFELYNGCEGDGYSFLGPDGVTYDEINPFINTTIQDGNGCNYNLFVDLIFNPPSPDVSDIYNGCQGDGYSFLGPDGVTYNETNPFINTTLQDGNGCDYNLFVDLTFNTLTPDVVEIYNGCAGDGYSFLGPDGVTYNESNPSVNTTIPDGNGCDYNLFVDLTFNTPTPDVNEIYNGCEGDGYSFLAPNGITYDEGNPSVNTTVQDGNGCDFNLLVDLTFNPLTPDINETYNGCEGDGYSYTSPNGTVYNEGNPTGSEIILDLNNCPYNVIVNLNFNTATSDINETYNGCEGDGYSYTSPSGTVYDESNSSGSEVILDLNNCPYNINVNLIFNPITPDIIESYTGCEGDGYSYISPSGTLYNEANPTGDEIINDINGCPYNVNVNLTFNTLTPDINETYNGCEGDGYFYLSPSGTLYDEGNPNGTETIQDGNGCPYNVNVNLTFNSLTPDINETYNGCESDGYFYVSPSGTLYDEGNPNGAEVIQDGNGCDYFVIVNLTFNILTPDIYEDYNGCEGDGYSYTSPSGLIYDELNPNGAEIIQDANDCPYNVFVNLVFNPVLPDVNETYNGCEGDGYSYISPSGTFYDEGNPSGTEIIPDGNGCDYNVNVNLTFNPLTSDIVEFYIGCEGDGYSYTSPSGTIYDETNPTGDETINDLNGCPYNVSVNLSFNIPAPDINETYNGCEGDGYTYTSPSGTLYDESNPTGTETVQDGNGCDYNVNVDLTYNTQTPDINETYNGCESDGYSYTSPSGTIYDEGNPSGTEIIPDANGCDYTVNVNLTFNIPTPDIYEDYNGCEGDGYSYTSPSGTLYNEGNPNDIETLQDGNDCPYDVFVNLVFNSVSPDINETYNGCESDGYSYISPSGTLYDEGNPSGTEIIPDGNGCDYNVTVNLTFNPLTTDIVEAYIGCEGDGYSYTSPSGTVYDEANPTGDETINDLNGCPYNISVDLTFNLPAPDINETYNGCEGDGYSYTSPSGTIYNEANPSGAEVLQDGNDCDYNLSVNLIFNELTADINESYSGCEGDGYSYTSPSGTVYDEGNPSGNETSIDLNGCPYNVNVNLDFATATPDITETYNGCEDDGYSYTSPSGTVYDETNPIGDETIQDLNGCDYNISVSLIFNTLPIANAASASACDEGGNQATFDLTNLDNTVGGGNTVTWYLDASAQVPITPSDAFVSGSTTIYATVSNGFCVSLPVEIDLTVTSLPAFTNLTDDCLISNIEYVVTFEITGGTPPYTVAGDPGTLAGTTFTSDPIVTGDPYSYLITDTNGCGPVEVTGVNLQCDCATDAGTMNNTLIDICVNETITANHLNDENLDGDDILVFVLHDNAGNSLGNILSTNTTPVFDLSIIPGLLTNTTYYISAVAGNDDGFGDVDPGDNCISVSQGTPFIIHELPTADLSIGNSICEGACFELTVLFTGTAPFDLDYTIDHPLDGLQNFNITTNDNFYIIDVCSNALTDGIIDISLLNVVDAFCTGTTANNQSEVEVNPNTTATLTGPLCSGSSIVINGITYNEQNSTGTEILTGNAFNGCDSIVQIDLAFEDALSGEELYNGCEGDGYVIIVNGIIYDQGNPTGMETIITSSGCDSIVTIDLSYEQSLNGEELYTGCENDGYSVNVNGNTYNQSNPNGVETVQSSLGCDSIVVINLVYNNATTGTEDHNGCLGDGYSVIVNGNSYNEANSTGTEVLTNSSGCDSTVTINLLYNSSVTGEEQYTGCIDDGYSVVVNGNTYDESNTNGTETLTSSGGCDSIVTVALTFNTELAGEEIYTGCEDDGYNIIVNGNTYNQNNPNGSETLISTSGCDSIVTINLLYNQITNGEEQHDGCEGDGYAIVVNGVVYNESNPIGSEILTSTSGCDSIVTISLAFNDVLAGEEQHNGCIGDGYSIVVNGVTYNETNPIGLENLTSTSGCDSIVTINLAFNDVIESEEQHNGCIGDGYSIVVNGVTYDETNPIGLENLTSTSGCDSIVTINLAFNDIIESEEQHNGCIGDGYSIVVNGNTYNETNPIGSETLTSISGCDSIISINLAFNDVLAGEEQHNGCIGDGYSIVINGNTYNETNPIGSETLTSTSGCDSIVSINLAFNDVLAGEEQYTGCINDGYSIVVNGNTYDQDNPLGAETLTSSTGCDSIVSINLAFNDLLAGDATHNGCIGDGYSIVINGNTYDETNPTGSETLTSSLGCDSIVSINLAFNDILYGEELYTGCVSDGYSVIVNGNTYDETTTSGTETLGSSGGCDSIVTILLTFNTELAGTELYTGCENDGYSVIVNGNTYDQNNPSGSETLISTAGCDSIVSINLFYNLITNGTEQYEGCQGDGYAIFINGNIYNESNPIGSETIMSSTGCDSVVTINLAFNDVLTGEEMYAGCFGDGYTIMINGNTYDQSNPTGSETLISTAGCDSIVTISLTFNDVLSGEEMYTGCFGDGYTILVNGNTYDQSNPTGSETLTSTAGCDSIVTINLAFNDVLTGEEIYSGCIGDGYTILVNGNTYDQSNSTGSETLTSSAGCDSIVTINLLFNDVLSGSELYTGCIGDGYTIVINGNTYHQSNPIGSETLSSSNGCDSIVSINLNYLSPSSSTEIYIGCQGDGYSIVVNGNTYNETNPLGSETISGGNYQGCDSIVTIALAYIPAAENAIESTICENQSITVNGNTYDITNPGGIEVVANGSYTGCDSIITVALEFTNEVTFDLMQTICNGDNVMVYGTVYDFSNPSGTEILIGGSSGGCDSVINVSLDFYPEISASLTEDAFICHGDSVPITFIFDGGTTYDVEFEAGGVNSQFTGISSGHTIMVAPSSTTTYSILDFEAIGIPCDPIFQTSAVTISVSEISISAEVNTDFGGYSVGCNGSEDGAASAVAQNGAAPYTYAWSNGSTAASTENLATGAYTVTATDAIGCTAVTDIFLTEPAGILMTANSTASTCYGDNDGLITIDTIIGGTAPYEYSMDGEFYQSAGSFPIIIPFVESGTYDVTIQDVNDCNTMTSVTVASPPQVLVNLGDDVPITLGDSVEINVMTNIEIDEYSWSTTNYFSCDTCLNTYTTPYQTQLYTIQVTDSLGCTGSDDILISVHKPRDVYIPNAFSPNGDGINDHFFVNTGQEVVNIRTMIIFDRWGESVFESSNLEANNPTVGWDGTFNLELLNPGVFVYMIELEFIDGYIELYSGDVTLMK